MSESGTGRGAAREIVDEGTTLTCDFCKKSNVNTVEYGPLFQLDGITAHHYCLMFSAGLSQEGEDDEGIQGFLPQDIRKELKRGKLLRCKFCRKSNATIGCCIKKCRNSYHFSCGLENGFQFQFLGDFESYCSDHMEKVEIPKDDPSITWECRICFSQVEDGESPILSACCKKGVFHKACITRMGQSHGLEHFKCPLCNDKEIFSVAVRKAGVYLPDKDASWEEDPGAFREHRQRYRKCDAKKCLCPEGRVKCPNWEIVLCGGCAGSGIHPRCGKLKRLSWRCPTCAPILGDEPEPEASSSSSAEDPRPPLMLRRGLQPGSMLPPPVIPPVQGQLLNLVSRPPTANNPLRTVWINPAMLFAAMRATIVLTRVPPAPQEPALAAPVEPQPNHRYPLRGRGQRVQDHQASQPKPNVTGKKKVGRPRKNPIKPKKVPMKGEVLRAFRHKNVLKASLTRFVNLYKQTAKVPNISVAYLPILQVQDGSATASGERMETDQ